MPMLRPEPLLANVVGTLGDEGIDIICREPIETSAISLFCYSPKPVRSLSFISYHRIVFCSVLSEAEDLYTISYVSKENKSSKLETIDLQISSAHYQDANDLARRIITAAYTGTYNQPRILLLLNLKGGKGEGASLYKNKITPILKAAGVIFTCIETEYSGHATRIAQDLDIDKYEIVACCSGDGIPHEFINGLYLRPDCEKAMDKISITQLPCGSGNALALSTYGTADVGLATLEMLKLTKHKMDLMLITQGDKKSLSFLSQAYGSIADSDIGTESFRWLGSIRFEIGLAYLLLTKKKYPCDIYVKFAIEDKKKIQEHFRLYEGSRETLSTGSCSSRRGGGGDGGGDYRGELHSDGMSSKLPDLNEPVPSDWQMLPRDLTDDVSIFYVGKMPYVLSDAQFFPAAINDDGYMDLIVFYTRTSFLDSINLMMNVSNGAHVYHEDVLHAKLAAYRLVPRVDSQKHYISVDGESFPVEPMQVEVLPRVLLVLLKNSCFVDTQFGEN